MSAPTCSRCRGRRWVRYFSETTDGNFEEAFGLCSCNHRPEVRGENHREEPEYAKNVATEKLASRRIGAISLRIELW